MHPVKKSNTIICDTPDNRVLIETLRSLQRQVAQVLMAAEFAHEVECAKCGGRNVQFAYWVEVNSGRVVDQFGSWNERDARWCPDCGEHTDIVDIGYDVEDTRPLALAVGDEG